MLRKLLLISIVGFSLPAMAVLGQKVDSIEKDQKRMSAANSSQTEEQNFTIHEFSKSGLRVREYADVKGTIFGIVWQATRHPELQPLLGEYFSDFTAAVKAAPKVRGRRAFSIVQGNKVIVERSGHMGGVQGKAYAPELFPAGVTANDIQ